MKLNSPIMKVVGDFILNPIQNKKKTILCFQQNTVLQFV